MSDMQEVRQMDAKGGARAAGSVDGQSTAGASTEGRLGNVAGALWLGAGDDVPAASAARHTAEQLAALFDEVVVLGDAPDGVPDSVIRLPAVPSGALSALVSALEATRAPRVVFVAAPAESIRAESLLALTAWPDHEVVRMRTAASDAAIWLIGRRDPVLDRAHERVAAGERDLAPAVEGLDVGWLDESILTSDVTR